MPLPSFHRLLILTAAAIIAAAPIAPPASGAKPKTSQKVKTRKGAVSGKKQAPAPAPTRRRAKAANAAPKSAAEARKLEEATQKEIALTREQLKLNEQEVKAGLADLNKLSAEISDGRAKVGTLQKKVNSLGAEIGSLGTQIAANEAELQRMREEYLKAVRKMRTVRRNQSALAFIFASDNFNQALRRMRYMRQFSEWKEKQTADINTKITQLGTEKNRLAEAKEQQSLVLGQLSASQRELEGKHRKQQRLVADLRQNGTALQSHLSAKQQEANRLKESISTLIAQEQAKAEAERRAREKAEADRRAREKAEADRLAREKAEAEAKAAEAARLAQAGEADRKAAEKKAAEERKAEERRAAAERKEAERREKQEREARKKKEKEERKKNSEKGSRRKADRKKGGETASAVIERTPAAKDTPRSGSNVDFASLRGSLPRPVDGPWRITNAFGRHSMPELPEVVYDNPGIDAEVQAGSAVKAVCGGKVSGVYKVAGYGNVVIVNHGEHYTVYGNLSTVNVSVGTPVSAGQKLGTAGHDPDDSRRGSVHFEVWKGREKQNPSAWLR